MSRPRKHPIKYEYKLANDYLTISSNAVDNPTVYYFRVKKYSNQLPTKEMEIRFDTICREFLKQRYNKQFMFITDWAKDDGKNKNEYHYLNYDVYVRTQDDNAVDNMKQLHAELDKLLVDILSENLVVVSNY